MIDVEKDRMVPWEWTDLDVVERVRRGVARGWGGRADRPREQQGA